MSKVTNWRDAQTYEDLYACGIKGFLFPDNMDKPEAEVVAAVKESMERIEAGDYEVVCEISGGEVHYPIKPGWYPPDRGMPSAEDLRNYGIQDSSDIDIIDSI